MSFFKGTKSPSPSPLSALPQHIAVIMDGNGRWAKSRFLPRVAGHQRGVESVHSMIRACLDKNIPYLTLFAFSSENWKRPEEEVHFLMGLFLRVLEHELKRLHEKNVCVKIIGNTDRFSPDLKNLIDKTHQQTAHNTALTLTVAVDYGGRWDILQAINALAQAEPDRILSGEVSESHLKPYLSTGCLPDPDLFIRTGGECRISNFLLWQLAYTELYFTETLWPDFDEAALELALSAYQKRERRFGQISEQVQHAQN